MMPSPTLARFEMAQRRLKTDRDLWLWISGVLGYRIPWRQICEHHQPPFSWLADAFFERKERTLTRASRDSGKTLMYAVLDLVNSHFKPGCGTTHVGSTKTQSKDGYAYLSGTADKHGQAGMVRRPPLDGYLASEPMMERTVWQNGSVVRILTGGSERSVSGPHPQKALLDEIDHWKPGILNTALLMTREGNGVMAQTHLASSQYNSFGTMAGLMVEAPRRGFEVYEWCLFDVMAQCPHCPNGAGKCALYEWFNPFTGNMEPLCQGRGAIADGHLSYRDACNKFSSVDGETAALQLLLIGGSRNGLVLSSYDEDRHIRELPDGDLDRWRFYAGVDLRTFSVIECVAEAPNQDIYFFDEWYHERSRPSMVRNAARDLQEMWKRERGINIEIFWLDPSQPDEVRDWVQEEGLVAETAVRKPIMYGIRMIRDRLMSSAGETSMYISQRCQRLRLEWGRLYHLQKNSMTGKFDQDKPADEDNHASDAARYGLTSGVPKRMRVPPPPIGMGKVSKWR